MKLTTKTIRRVVELCGPSLRCLYMNQCTNIYTTALWYLCGLFKGKILTKVDNVEQVHS